MRLIDADKLTGNMNIQNALYLIDEQPTAYDVDKVLEQLEELKENYRKVRKSTYCRSTETDDCDSCRADHYLEARLSTVDRVIGIVKGVGV